jgi:hypothetical protein
MRWIVVAALLLATPAGAWAGFLPDGGVTAQEVAASLKAKGFQAEITSDKDGDPLVKSVYEGTKFSVYFYECSNKQRCKSIQYATGFSMDGGIPVPKVAEWNRKKRFGRVYRDDDSDPWIEMDMDLEHGATTEALANNIDRWLLVIREFRKYIGR